LIEKEFRLAVLRKSARIVIDPVTRVEGHGKITILLDDTGKVSRVRLHIVEFRGFERFVQGRLLWEVPVIVQRLCGICPVSHHLTAAKAMDQIVGSPKLTPTAEKMRRLMHYAQILQSHATHLFYLAAPDLLFGFDAPAADRNVAGVIKRYPEFARQGIALRKFGQEILATTYGKKIHGTGAIPGGVNKHLTIPERDLFLHTMPEIMEWVRHSLQFIKDYTLEHRADLSKCGSFECNNLCLVKDDGALDLYDGGLRATDAKGKKIFDHVPCSVYRMHILEEVKDWTYLKFPFFRGLGPQLGWYRVGPLARITACSHIDTPEAEMARADLFNSVDNELSKMAMLYHWARMIEMLHAAEKIQLLLNDGDLLSDDRLAARGPRTEEAVAVLEAPRGTLFHHYRIDRNDLVTMANLIVSTTQNNEPMNRTVDQVVRQQFAKAPEITEGMLNRVEAAIRAYDPCLSCAAHAIGAMALEAELYDCKGVLLQRKRRS
jgi:NAD-reducing hydrogenase large subunit